MGGVYLRGVGLSCALGMDAESCVSVMLEGHAEPPSLLLDDLKEPLNLRYYRIQDGAGLFDTGRFEKLLPSVVRAAVAQAALSAADIRSLPIFVGSSCFSVGLSEEAYRSALAKHRADAVPMPVCDYDYPAKLAQQALGSVGDTWAYNTACTSGANAMLGALRMLELGRHRHALVIGAELANRTTLTGFTGLQILADAARPFDASRMGMALGEGIGAVLLSTETGSGARLRILGGASNCDTYSVTTANPDGRSVAEVLQLALARTGLTREQVRAIKAHGTGTPSGDQAEASGLEQVFGPIPPVSALKSNIGHTLGACGIIELVLYAGALSRGFIPATRGFETPDPAFSLRPLQKHAAAQDGHYLLNHFGFGGSNTVLVLERSSP